jgi:hypothetical protein
VRGVFSAPTSNDSPTADAVRRHHPAWDRAFSAALVAAIVLALSTGIWRASDGTPLGFGDGPPDSPGIPFGGQVAQDDSGDIDPADLPTAEDCTVEPLTVDEVIWYIQDPYEASFSTDMASPGPLPTEVVPATPPATNPPNYEPGPASQDVLDAAADTQRMWMACILAESYFQVWALENPYFVREQIISALPPLTGEDEARAILEDLRDNGPANDPQADGTFYAFSYSGYPGLGGIHVIDTDPANAWQDDARLLSVGYTAYNEEGMVERQSSSIFDNGRGTPIALDSNGVFHGFLLESPNSCASYSLNWNEARAMWLISAPPVCG